MFRNKFLFFIVTVVGILVITLSLNYITRAKSPQTYNFLYPPPYPPPEGLNLSTPTAAYTKPPLCSFGNGPSPEAGLPLSNYII